MSFIYKISNTINSKLYIGKTSNSIEKRWKEHLRDSKKESLVIRPLYRAMKKYGTDVFKIELVEEVSESSVNVREIYWINYYNSFKEGYNATLGGDGSSYIDRDSVVSTYTELKSMRATSNHLNIDEKTVRKILKECGIKILPKAEMQKEKQGKSVAKLNKDTDEIVETFSSIKDAAKSVPNASFSHISSVCSGKRKTAYGFKWSFI